MKNPIKFQLRKYFSIVLLSLITAVLLSAFFISLPATEQLVKKTAFDITTKDSQYFTKVYNIELTYDKNASNTQSKLDQTQNAISNRLRKFGVEDFKIKESKHLQRTDEENKYRTLRITVTTTRDEADLDSMVASRSELRIVTPKDGVDFNADQLAQFLPENYERTSFNRNHFRTIYIKDLETQSGGASYFALLKPWPNSDTKFKDFLDEWAGKVIGVQTDNFVTPVTVPLAFDKDLPAGTAGQKSFSFNVAATREQAEIVDILYNSGLIPQPIRIERQEKLDYQAADINFSQVAISIAVGVILISAYMYFKNNKQLERMINFLVTFITVSTFWVAGLKLFDIPIDLFMLLLEMLLLIMIVKQATYRNYNIYRIEVMSVILIILAYLFGFGYLKIFAKHMFVLMTLTVLLIPVLKIYLNNMKRFLIR